MFDDSDIKIAGERHFIMHERSKVTDESLTEYQIDKSRLLGKSIAEKFVNAANNAFVDDASDTQMLIQRRLLLSFTVSVALDECCVNDAAAGVAEKAFLDELSRISPEFFSTSNDTGAFSFYYLAYRRRTEVDRRIGQTFAMLCAHDGDPIYQELGEALYCWFKSVIEKEIANFGVGK